MINNQRSPTINSDQQWTYHQHLHNVFLLIRSFTHWWGLFKIMENLPFNDTCIGNFQKVLFIYLFLQLTRRHQYSAWIQLAKFLFEQSWSEVSSQQESPWLYCEKVIASPCSQLCQVMFQLWIIIIISNKWSEQTSGGACTTAHQPLTIFWFINFEITSKYQAQHNGGGGQGEAILQVMSDQSVIAGDLV